ncbi:lectin [Athelia psychrophila]|uniref:Lectin n=1 Tax=Athelia psychrophila TaxID=1759441 RepID=A0A166RZP3_9AGAM|nr:lectin [Fibularhizoctonia sp. CBS 109695]KZP28837.1 lectin [Fibularhizoctonia sp. CBS 109695]
MSYKITASVFQTNPNTSFRVVEQTVFHYANGGTWDTVEGQKLLTMGGSGTSGTIRFLSENGQEGFIVALGVHNYKRWCDVITNLKSDETGVLINPQYYNNGGRDYQREKQLVSYSVKNAKGREIGVKFTTDSGNDLRCNIIVG